jgi:hypothetical protein
MSVKNGGLQSVSTDFQAQQLPTSETSLSHSEPGVLAASPLPSEKTKKEILSARPLAQRKPPSGSLSQQRKSTDRPPLPPCSVHVPVGSASRDRRPSLDEGAASICVPPSCPPTRAPNVQQLRADALPTAVMNFVAEADTLVQGRLSNQFFLRVMFSHFLSDFRVFGHFPSAKHSCQWKRAELVISRPWLRNSR